MRVYINMPQMAANGLSENWLFRQAGDTHWQALCASLGAPSAALSDAGGQRLYPTFVAIAARYDVPLSEIQENDSFDTVIRLAHFGQAFFHSLVAFENPKARLALEMLTAFASRETPHRNDLRKSVPAPFLRYTSTPLPEAPPILNRAKAMRRAELAEYEFEGHRFDLTARGASEPIDHEPSPYFEFNGANLLYFAAYPTIADTLERRIIRRDGLAPASPDWVLASSTVARDVYYYRNLEIGGSVRAHLRAMTIANGTAYLHTTLSESTSGEPIADVFTQKRLLTPAAA